MDGQAGVGDSTDAETRSVARLHTAADRRWRGDGPTGRAITAFGADTDRLRLLPGGQGSTWSDGAVVLKPVGFEPEQSWISDVYINWTAHDAVRVPEPIAAHGEADTQTETRWVVDGWAAHAFVPGRDLDLPRELPAVREASASFHRAVADLPRPEWLDDRDDPWSYGDRLAWEGAMPVGDARVLDLMDRLIAALGPVASPSQPIHGDILPNVLLATGRPPAVVDWPPYHRPAAFADAVAVTDAVTFKGAPMRLLDEWAHGPDWRQLLVRALLYRLGPTGFFTARDSLTGSLLTHVERVGPVIDEVLAHDG